MKLGTKVGPGYIVLDRDPVPKGAQPSPPIFGPCPFSPNGSIDEDAT